jgi:Cys-rich protein (TIGR01571 family)
MFFSSLFGGLIPQSYMTPDGNVYTEIKVSTSAVVVLAIRYTLALAFSLYLLVATCRTRASIRERYAIPEQSCQGCEDCCCSYWCNCCTIAQMMRHTADYDTYDAQCCTETGLPAQRVSYPNVSVV